MSACSQVRAVAAGRGRLGAGRAHTSTVAWGACTTGTVFLPNGHKAAFVRAAFSLLTPEEVDEALKRLRDTVLAVRAAGSSA
jgi:hypothetical protein